MEKNKPKPEDILLNHIDKQSMDEVCENIWPDMLEAMQEFADLYHKEKLREELMLFMHNGKNSGESCFDNLIESIIDEYLKTKP